MKKASTTVLGTTGTLYGLIAILLIYQDAPLGLQAFIVAGVGSVGASAGWLIGLASNLLRQKCRTDTERAA